MVSGPAFGNSEDDQVAAESLEFETAQHMTCRHGAVLCCASSNWQSSKFCRQQC